MLRPIIARGRISFLGYRDYAVEPHGTTVNRESLPVAPNVFLVGMQNDASHFGIENLVEVSQQLSLTGDMDGSVMISCQQWICNHSRNRMTVVCLKLRLKFSKKG